VFSDVIIGVGRSSLTHSVGPSYPLRLSLLAFQDGVLAIEIADAPKRRERLPRLVRELPTGSSAPSNSPEARTVLRCPLARVSASS